MNVLSEIIEPRINDIERRNRHKHISLLHTYRQINKEITHQRIHLRVRNVVRLLLSDL